MTARFKVGARVRMTAAGRELVRGLRCFPQRGRVYGTVVRTHFSGVIAVLVDRTELCSWWFPSYWVPCRRDT